MLRFSILWSLVGDGRKYVGERSRLVSNFVAEISSQPRAAAAAELLPELGCIPGFAIDITVNDEFGNSGNFDEASQQ